MPEPLLKSDTSSLLAPAGGLLQRLEHAFSQFNERCALETAHHSISYQNLDHWVAAICRRLQKQVPAEGGRVAVISDEPMEYVAAMLAAFRLGVLYVPMNREAPAQRSRQILEEVAPSTLLVGTVEKLPAVFDSYPQTNLPLYSADLADIQMGWTSDDISEEQPAYVFYTSGSTGRPKGIVGKLSSLDHFVDWETKTFALDCETRISQFTTPTFDAFLRDVLTPLSVGGTLCIPPAKPTLLDADSLWDWIEDSRTSLIHCVPSLFSALLEGNWKERALASLKHVLLAGEALPIHLAEDWLNHRQRRIELINLYGSTETTMVKLFHRIQLSDIERGYIPVGRPMPETEVWILDEAGLPCSPGIAGEIHIATHHRTLGYFNQPEATAKAFKHIPPTSTLAYATGDLGMLLPDGNLRLFGRKDRQVKMGGVRIEQEEIERALLSIPEIEACAVTIVKEASQASNLIAKEAVEKAASNNSEKSVLVAYLVANKAITVGNLRDQLSEQLAPAAIPTRFYAVDKLPRNNNGKTDYPALAALKDLHTLRDEAYAAPETPLEVTLAEIWQNILNLTPISRNDHFFSLGGDSLKAMQVVNRLRSRQFETVSISDLLRHPQLKDFCQELEATNAQPLVPSAMNWLQAGQPTRKTYPLTPAQQGLWFLWKMDPESPYYTCQGIVHLRGKFSRQSLKSAWKAVGQKHDMLRVRFASESGTPTQRFVEQVDDWSETQDLDHLEQEAAVQTIRALAKEDAQRPFKLEGDPLIRARLFRLADDHYALQLTMHEITVDLWAIRILMQDLGTFYEQALHGQNLDSGNQGPSFRQYLHWLEAQAASPHLDSCEAFWKQELSGELPVLNLPFDRTRPAQPTYQGRTVHCLLSENLSQRLKAFSQSQGNTLYVTLLSGFFWMLHRYSGQKDIIVGSPIAQRNQVENEQLFGFFLNMLPIRHLLDSNLPFESFLQSTKEKVTAALNASDYPFSRMLEWAQSIRDTSTPPVFQVMFNMLSYAEEKLDHEDFSLSYESLETGHTKYDLSLYAQEYGDRLFLQIAYQTELFDEETVAAFLKNLETFFESMVEQPQQSMKELSSIHAEEENFILKSARGPVEEIDRCHSLISLFESRAQQNPQGTALLWNGRSLSYEGLSALSNQLAYNIVNHCECSDAPIAIYQDRSFHMIAAVLAVMKVGCPYVYLDPHHPAVRNEAILEETKPQLLITDESEALHCKDCPILVWDNSQPIDLHSPAQHLHIKPIQSDRFHIVYTSASTGKPKGVVIRQDALHNRFQWMWKTWPFEENAVMVLQKSLSLVASSWECLGALLQGVPTVIADYETVLDPGRFAQLCEKHSVTRMYGSPALFGGVLAEHSRHPDAFNSITLAFTSAEPITPAMVRQWKEHFPEVPLFNLYGSTECSSNALVYECSNVSEEAVRVPLGRPLPNIQAFVLDEELKLAPQGAVGELCISGACLAQGYLEDEALNEQNFIEDHPLSSESGPLYKTGDQVKLNRDGQLDFLGRNDFQINIRGFRIEPAEVENVLLSIDGVDTCVVLDQKDQRDRIQLTAYYTGDKTLNARELRKEVRNALPDYMVPAILIHLDALPRNTNGKIKRGALPIPDSQLIDTSSPSSVDVLSLTSSLKSLWQQHLGLEEVGVDDNFFEVGGHSLMAAQLFAEIERITGKSVAVSALYQAPTIRSLVQYLEEDGLRKLWSSIVPMQQDGNKAPLFCVAPWDGNAIYFRCLPKYLEADQPLYGLEPLDSEGNFARFDTLDEILEKYVTDLTSFYPDGPINLCGFSGGGVIAWEIASRLQEQGRQVDKLILFDTSRPGYRAELMQHLSARERRARKWTNFRRAIKDQQGIKRLWHPLETIFLKLRWHLSRPNQEAKEMQQQEEAAMAANREHFEAYAASHYNGQVFLMKARDRRLEMLLDPAMGWSAYAKNGIALREVPGGHNSMLLEPNCRTLCRMLQDLLNTPVT